MKKFFASIAAIMLSAIATTASAQAVMIDDSFPLRYGIQLGFNMPTFAGSQYSATIGYNMGATVLYDLQDFIPNSYGRVSALYTRKGTSAGLDQIEVKGSNYTFEDLTSYLHYLETPIHFGYAFEVNDMLCVMAETGPYLAFRWSGSLRTDKTAKDGVQTEPTNDDMKDYYRDLRRFDLGWGVRGGVLFDKKYELSVGYDWGLCNVVSKETGCNLNLSINATVYFD